MKKATNKSRLILWLSIAAIILIAAIVAVFLLIGNRVQKDLPENPKLYWNVDRPVYFGTGALRYPDDDGFYQVTFAQGGEQVRLPVEDPILLNRIDTMPLMALEFDDRGVVVNAIAPADCTGGYAADRLYVEAVDGNRVTCNFSYMFDSYQTILELDSNTKIWSVGDSGILVGVPTELRISDQIIAIKDASGRITEVFTYHYKEPGTIYWNVERKYDSTNKLSTREPDATGVYTFTLAVNGTTIEAKTRDQNLVHQIDGEAARCFGLLFDEEGYISAKMSTFDTTGGAAYASWYHTDYISNGQAYFVRTFEPYLGQTGICTIAPNCKIVNVSGEGPMGEYTDLRHGDMVHCLRDNRNCLCYIFVISRRVDSPIYWNVERKYDSAAKATARVPDAQGYYHYLLAVDGKQVNLKTKDPAVANQLDAKADKHFALKLEGDEIIAVYGPGSALGGTYFASWFDVVDISDGVVTAERTIGGNLQGTQQSAKMAENCKVYNVSELSEMVGEETTLMVGDRIHGETNMNGELEVIYVVHRDGPAIQGCICGLNPLGQHFGACDGTLYEWKGWTSTTSLPTTSGYYYLMDDVKLTEVAVLAKDAHVYLDMKGFDIQGPTTAKPRYLSWRIYDFNSDKTAKSLTLTDSSKEKSSRLTVHRLSDQIGGVVWVRGSGNSALNIYGGYYDATNATSAPSRIDGRAVAASAGFINMYGGTIDARDLNSRYGAALCLSNATMYMFGGTIKGGKATEGGGAIDVYKGTLFMNGGTVIGGKAQYGGAINIRNGSTFQLLDGTVKNGTSTGSGGGNIIIQDGSFTMTGGTVSGGMAQSGSSYGGNIFGYSGKSVITISGGTVEDGQAKYGGNIFMNNKAGATLNLNGGTIVNGQASDVGGNVYMYTGSSLNMTGGIITGGLGKNGVGDNLYCFQSNNTITGGTVAGNTECRNGTLKLGGNPVIFGEDATKQLILGGALITPVSAFTDANIHITGSGFKLMEYSDLATDAFLSCIHADGRISKEPDGIYLRNADDILGCLCGQNDRGAHYGTCDGSIKIWTKWEQTDSLPTQPGYYYLTAPVKLTAAWSATSGSYVFDLAGQTVTQTANGQNLFALSGSAKLTLTDSKTGGKLIGASGNRLGQLSAGSALDIYNVTIDATASTADYGAGLNVNSATVNMYAGTIKGGTVTANSGGGSVILQNSAVFNFYDGTITGGRLTNPTSGAGGNVTTWNAACVFNQYGGSVEGGSAVFGGCNVYVRDGAYNLIGGAIGGGNAKHGGSVYVSSKNGGFTMTGGTVTGGTATEGGGAIDIDGGKVSISGGTIKGGTAQYGGAMNIRSNGTVTLSGSGIIDGGSSTGSGGGNVIVQAGSFTMNGGTVKNGKSLSGSGYGGNVFVFSATGKFILNDGMVENGNAKFGGNIFANNAKGATVEIHGGTVIGGTCSDTGAGGNIYMYTNSVLKMTDGTITGGSRVNGSLDSIMIMNATFRISGGTIAGGVSVNSGTMELSGSCVIYAEGASYNLSLGGSVVMNLTGALTDSANIHVSGTAGKKLISAGALDASVYTHAASRITADTGATVSVEADGIYLR